VKYFDGEQLGTIESLGGWTLITIPDVPPSLNKYLRMHWAVKKRLRQHWAWALKVALARVGFSPAGERTPKMSVNITIFLSRRFDRENSWGGCKPIIDAMRDVGLIRNDSERWLDLGVAQTIGEPHTVIEFRKTSSIEPATRADNKTGGDSK
jgi:hypothetical protein